MLKQLPDKKRSQIFSKYCHCATGGSELEEDLQKIKDGVYVLMGTVGRLREIGQKF
jgi:superfamily II DNA/RNA helicase